MITLYHYNKKIWKILTVCTPFYLLTHANV